MSFPGISGRFGIGIRQHISTLPLRFVRVFTLPCARHDPFSDTIRRTGRQDMAQTVPDVMASEPETVERSDTAVDAAPAPPPEPVI
jgi:hypothetical protein